MNIIDMSKEYKTIDGRKVKILCTDMVGDYSVVAAVFRDDGTWSTYAYTREGRFSTYIETEHDLVETEKGVWVVLVQGADVFLTYSRKTEQEIEDILEHLPTYKLIGKHFFPFPRKENP